MASLRLNRLLLVAFVIQLLRSFTVRAEDAVVGTTRITGNAKVYITGCSLSQYHLELECGRDQAADIIGIIQSQDHVRCAASDDPIYFNDVPSVLMANCEFETLPEKLLQNFGNLKSLFIVEGWLTEFRVEDLPPHRSSLINLSFRRNRLKAIDAAVLVALPELTTLDLWHNELQEMPVFPIGSRLKQLNLWSNRIAEVPSDSIKGLSLLEELNLCNNRLLNASLPFEHVKYLEVLDLSSNVIGEVLATDLMHLTKLRVLKLEQAHLRNIEFGAFSSMRELRKLVLSQNELTKMEFTSFLPAMTELEVLNLAENQLTELDENFDELFPKLDKLILAENQFNCTYLERFMRTLRRSAHAVNGNPCATTFEKPNFRGIGCVQEDEAASDNDVEDKENDQARDVEGFKSGYNVSIFVLALWTAASNLVICSAIVYIARRTA